MLHRRSASLVCLLVCAGCSTGSGGPLDADMEHDASPRDASLDSSADADADTDADVEEIDPTVLTNFSFDAAKHIAVDTNGVLQPLESATQLDYYAFEAEAGEVYVIKTNRGRFSPDNVLSFYSPDREKLAENDVGWVWPGEDIVRVGGCARTRVARTIIVVEDRVLRSAFTTDGVPTFFYRLTVSHLDTSTPGVGWEPSSSDDATAIAFVDDPNGVAYAILIGELSEGEVDHFELEGRAAQALIGHALPGGVSGNGSTLVSGSVDVRDETEHLVAMIDRGHGAQHIHPPVEAGPYTLSVSAGGAAGDNAFYVIDLVLLPDNPLEEESANDTFETAHALALEGNFLRRGTFLAQLPSGDLDYFAFEAMAGERLDVICEGESAGSGVRGLLAEIRDPNDEALGEATETIENGLRLERVIAEEAGTHYVRLSSETEDDSEAPPAWVRCAVITEI